MNEDMKLYKIDADVGRHGGLYGLFFAKPSDVERCKDVTIHLYDVLGKHSEIEVNIGEDIELVELPKEVCSVMLEHLGEHIIGINPIERALEQLESESDEEIE